LSEVLQALYRGDQASVDELLAGDPELDVFESAAVGRVDRLQALLDEDPALANAWAEDGFQPLGLASFFGHLEAARLLVERGAEVNSASRNDFKVMPLHSAVAEKDPETRYEIAKLLLEHGADPNTRQQDDLTPLMAADQQGDARLRELLVEHGAIG
jgi:ankyrin repeat protein